MRIQAIRTDAVRVGDDLYSLLDSAVTVLASRSVVAVTSNIVSLCESNVVPIGSVPKQDLIQAQADWCVAHSSYRGFYLTIKDSVLIPNAGIDESNTDGYYTLWPKDAQATANQVRRHLIERFDTPDIGVIIVDSKTTPLRRGVTGVAIAHSGFLALNNYIGQNDIFGRTFTVEQANVADGLAATAVLAMGEGDEQTPIAVIDEMQFVQFCSEDPDEAELGELAIPMGEDLYTDLLKGVNWTRGGTENG